MSHEDARKEIANTTRWGLSLLIAIIAQGFGIVWYFSQLDSVIKQHTADIQELKSGSSIYISREQLDDILGAQQTEIKSLKDSLVRIENKLDRILP